MKILTRAAALLFLAGAATGAAAQTDAQDAAAEAADEGGIQGYVSLGAGLMPDYEGASKYIVVPYADGQANLGKYFLRFDGGALQLNLIDSDTWHAGPLIGYRMGRGDVYSGAVARMAHIRYSMTEGGFVEWEHLAEDPRSGERITLAVAEGNINRDTGLDITLRGTIHRPLDFINPGFILSLSADTAFGDGKYMDTYFGVNGPDALTSGFPQFRGEAGIRKAGVSISVDQFLSEKWSVGLRLNYERLFGGAADSPVTAIAGSPDQMFGGVVVGYVL
ncbi:MAG: MipA/OmpV family protein [Alphaproteobacteria bacterium]|nr:MipA/OmpV family protein [Alphaproteobacteria bacterium]